MVASWDERLGMAGRQLATGVPSFLVDRRQGH